MKQSLKNENEMLGIINNIQAQLAVLDKKIDTLMNRSLAPAKLSPTVSADNNHQKSRVMHSAICADCHKECSIPFKPSGDRPVYCQDCFSRRKVISMSKIGIETKPPVNVQETVVKKKKKAVTVKKTVAKKKPVPKKK